MYLWQKQPKRLDTRLIQEISHNKRIDSLLMSVKVPVIAASCCWGLICKICRMQPWQKRMWPASPGFQTCESTKNRPGRRNALKLGKTENNPAKVCRTTADVGRRKAGQVPRQVRLTMCRQNLWVVEAGKRLERGCRHRGDVALQWISTTICASRGMGLLTTNRWHACAPVYCAAGASKRITN